MKKLIRYILIKLKIINPYDVNGDSKVNAQDYVLLKKYIMERNDK